jgi:hypothetical protein
LKTAVFWVLAASIISAMVEAIQTSESRPYDPEDGHLNAHRRENLKSYFVL